MELTENQESEILTTAIDYIMQKVDHNKKLTLEDETVIYITEIITIMGTANKPMEIYRLLSPKTKDAFAEIGAHEYAEVFGATFNSAKEELDKTKGLFKRFKRSKILKQHAVALYVATETLESSTSLISTYLVPYILKKYKDVISIPKA